MLLFPREREFSLRMVILKSHILSLIFDMRIWPNVVLHLVVVCQYVDKCRTFRKTVGTLCQFQPLLHPCTETSSLQHTALPGTLQTNNQVHLSHLNISLINWAKMPYLQMPAICFHTLTILKLAAKIIQIIQTTKFHT